MLLGLNSASYRPPAGLAGLPSEDREPDPFALLARAADLGLRGIEFADLSQFESLDYSYLSRLRSRAEALDLYLEVGASGTEPQHLEDLVRVCYALGASVLRTTIGLPAASAASARRPASPDDFETLLQQVVDNIRASLRLAKKYDVWIAIENDADLTSQELVSLLSHLEGEPVGACLDTANPLAVIEDPVEAARNLARRALTVHLKDYQMAPTHQGYALLGVPLGRGVVDLESIVEILQQANPDIALNIEVAAPRREIPVLEPAFLDAFTDRSAHDLAAVIRLMRDRRRTGLDDLAADAQPQDPDAAVTESAAYARRLLGQDSLPLDL